jgi:hypothetical protein
MTRIWQRWRKRLIWQQFLFGEFYAPILIDYRLCLVRQGQAVILSLADEKERTINESGCSSWHQTIGALQEPHFFSITR